MILIPSIGFFWHILFSLQLYFYESYSIIIYHRLFLQIKSLLLSGNTWQRASDECYGLALGYLTFCLAGLIPGYYISVLTMDAMGRKVIQFLGFILMAAFCSACSGTYVMLTNPNQPADPNNLYLNGTKR